MQSDASRDLNANLSETVNVSDVGSPSQPIQGLVAILDALGAATYSRDEADRFLESREVVMEATEAIVATSLKRFDPAKLRTFTFNDTIVFTYRLENLQPTAIRDIETFCHVLRTFEILSMAKGVFFRGALAIGEFYRLDPETNTVMGPAVSDAAAWYGLADWIGINATPHATMLINAFLETAGPLDHVLVDYKVPLKDGRKVPLKAVNWPKGFHVRTLRPTGFGDAPRAMFLSVLTQNRVPLKTEPKYFHTIDFFDFVEREQGLNGESGVSPSPGIGDSR